MQDIKQKILTVAKQKIEEKIHRLQQSMEEIQAAANEETKSSAGDKYETGRAMMHLEKEKYAQQLATQFELLKTLQQIDPLKPCEQVTQGALVYSSAGNYFLSASLGKLVLGSEVFFALSAQAPLGQQLLGKKVGDQLSFRNQKIKILNII